MEKPEKFIAIVAEGQEIKGEDWNVPTKVVVYQADKIDAWIEQEMAKSREKETVLEAWFDVFGTTQLTHAKDRLDVAEREVERLNREMAKKVVLDEEKILDVFYEHILIMGDDEKHTLGDVYGTVQLKGLAQALCDRAGEIIK